jgi:phosphotransferase system IIB component
MKYRLNKIGFALVTFAFTTFVLLNTYELVFNQDIAVANSIRKVAAQEAIKNAVQDFSSKALSDEINASTGFNNLDHLEIPALKMQLKIEEARKVNNEWYERPGAAHYIELNKNNHGAPIDYLFYTTQSWRTINEPDHIEKGMEVDVFFGSNDTAAFVVVDKKIAPLTQSLLVGKLDTRQILLIIENPENSIYYGYSLELKK